MTLNIPSTSVRSKYLKRLPVVTVYKDPKSKFNYEEIEKQMNNSLVKVAVPYLSSEKQPILLDEIPAEYLKLDSVPKANILKSIKIRLMELEETNKQLVLNQDKTLYQRIMDNLNGSTYYQSDNCYYFLQSGIVIPD